MKLTTEGTRLSSLLAPLRATDKLSEGIDYDKTKIAIRQEGDFMYLIAVTDQPHYSMFIKQNLSGDPKSDNPNMQGIDRNAVPCGENEYYEVRNSELMMLLRSVGVNTADFVITEDGMTAKIGEEQSVNIAAVRKKGKLDFCDVSYCVDCKKLGAATGAIISTNLRKTLRTPIAVSKIGEKSGRMTSKAVHLLLDEKDYGIEAFSGTAHALYTSCKSGAVPDGEDMVHLAISPKSAQVLLQMCSLSDHSVDWTYGEDNNLMVWCEPYFVYISCEVVEGCDYGLKVPDYSILSVNRIRLLNALRKSKNTGSKCVVLAFGENGHFCVRTPNGSFADEFAGSHLGERFVRNLTLPLDPLLACMGSYEAENIELHCEKDADEVVLCSADGLTCRVLAT